MGLFGLASLTSENSSEYGTTGTLTSRLSYWVQHSREGVDMLVLIHKECGGPAIEDSSVGEVCAIPIDRFPFPCFSCLEEIDDESEVRLSEELGF